MLIVRKLNSVKSIGTFINDNIEIIPDFEYGYVSKYYNMNSGVMKNSKLTFTKSNIDGLYHAQLKRDNMSNHFSNNASRKSEWEKLVKAKKR